MPEYRRGNRFPPVDTAIEYCKSSHIVRHNTIVFEETSQKLLWEILQIELSEEKLAYKDLSAVWRMRAIVSRIENTELLLKILDMGHEELSGEAHKALQVLDKGLANHVSELIFQNPGHYPKELLAEAKRYAEKMSNSITFMF